MNKTSFSSQLFVVALISGLLQTHQIHGQSRHVSQVPPEASGWPTFVLSSPAAIKVAPPPGKETTQTELAKIASSQQKIDSAMLAEIHYWNAGPPVYRWQKIADNLYDSTQYWLRVYAYMNVAIYDATLAAWQAKYTFNRPRPYATGKPVKHLIPPLPNPSYPCEHSVTAGAAATVLAYLFPSKADSLMQLARRAGNSRIAAGVQYPSDVEAGFELGVNVAREVIARAMQDGYDKPWKGSLPKGRPYYTGKPLKKDLAHMKTWVLTSASQFRSPPPPDLEKDIADMKAFKADDMARQRAFKWEFSWPWGDVVDQKILEYNLNNNAPKAAFVYALVSISDYDNQIAHWDGKYTYYRARPNQYDTTFVSLFATPPSPSYPAGHGTMAYTRATVLSYLFPYDSKQFFEMAREANHSRFEAGVHYLSDNQAGEVLGRKVGEEIVKWAKTKMPAW